VKSLSDRLAQAVERAREAVMKAIHATEITGANDETWIAIMDDGIAAVALARYGDLRALQGRWEESDKVAHWACQDGDQRSCLNCRRNNALEAEIEALIGGGP